MDGKKENKKILLSRLGLTYNENTPLIAMVSRISIQKGFDLVLEAMDNLLKQNLQIYILGDGDRSLVEKLYEYRDKYPEKFAMSLSSDEKMVHLVEAGADILLMPSKYEPCGLQQIYSLRYGTIPIVSAVGGLFDTVDDLDVETGEGTGFILEQLSAKSIVKAVKKAVAYYKKKEQWAELQKRIMEEDFSWELSAKRYLDVYSRALNE
ncbi:MAG TPA: glycosyltransferase [Calditrichaeota bacterium]|nr:glycosyltransferase [Calditrichota bacterium]